MIFNRIDYHKTGFTLMELLVVMGIIAIISGLLVPSIAQAKRKAYFINELNSGKQLMVAYKMYTDDHEGHVMSGYRYDLPARDRVGNPIEHPINARYPWRIAPYLGNNFEIMYANENRSLLRSFDQGDESAYTYSASVFPSLAVNSIFVGGDDLILPPSPKAFDKFGRFCVLRESEAHRPSDLITFASGRAKFDGDIVKGFYRVEAPYLTKRSWAETWDNSLAPEMFGFVDPRYNERAIVALFDGHVEGYNLEQLQDMRHWANQADRPDWVLKARNVR